MKLHLLTTLYPVRSAERRAELMHCIETNLRNPYVEDVTIFMECVEGVDAEWLLSLHASFGERMTLLPIDHRTTYADYFVYANEKLAGQMVLICNTDIFYDESLRLVERFAFPMNPSSFMLAITRYNYHPVSKKSDLQGWEVGGNCGSQDTWIFKAPIRKFNWDITVGVIGCDSLLAQRAQEAGIALANPAVNIRTHHLHQVNERNDAPEGKTYWQHPEYRGVTIPFCSA